jgi:hypothetical protein
MFLRRQCRTCPRIVLFVREHMPDDGGQFSRCRDGCNLHAAAGTDAQEKRAQWAWGLCCSPGRLYQHGACVRTT